MQNFQLPRKVLLERGVIRLNLLGRHQHQTFEIPEWLQQSSEDRLPKYYCCLSYVSAMGLVYTPQAS